MLHCANHWLRLAEQVSLTPSIATRVTSSSCGNKCAHQRRSSSDQQEVQQRTVATVTQGAYRLYCFIQGQHIDCVHGS